MLIVDASVACKWYLDEAGSDLARSMIAGDHELVAPDIILAEVANALWRCQLRGEIEAHDASIALGTLASMFRALVPIEPVMEAAFGLAVSLGHPVYDCIYLIVARDLDLPVITADARLCAKIQGTEWEARVLPLERLTEA